MWGSGFKGKWASMQGRMGGVAADRDNVCGEVSHAAIWVGGAMRVGGGLCVWRQQGGGEDRLTRRRRERWGGGEGAVTRCARFWFCVRDGGVRRVFDGAVLGRASVWSERRDSSQTAVAPRRPRDSEAMTVAVLCSEGDDRSRVTLGWR